MKKTDYISAEIIDDSDDEIIIIETNKNTSKKKRVIKPKVVLEKCYNQYPDVYEIGVDEVGRGPLFGRVYTAAVILPKDDSFDCSMVKDSKKFTSKKKILEASEYIKKHALAWYISFEDEKTIDEINILQATQRSMHDSIHETMKQMNKIHSEQIYNYSLLIDGNYFNPMSYLNKKTNKIESFHHVTIEGGDNKYASIAAASILAKVERDKYIEKLCAENPILVEHYSIDSNKGYGTKKHLDGIKEHGITIWHRRTFGICSTSTFENPLLKKVEQK
jgi:ribonuclease HII